MFLGRDKQILEHRTERLGFARAARNMKNKQRKGQNYQKFFTEICPDLRKLGSSHKHQRTLLSSIGF
jgi:hypothetical protein